MHVGQRDATDGPEMAKTKVRFICRECGSVQSKWMGKCPDCGAWDALEEHRETKGADASMPGQPVSYADPSLGQAPDAMPLPDITDQAIAHRISTGINEFNRVLGGTTPDVESNNAQTNPIGGLVAGSTVLVGGDPGIGKSTLLLQASLAMARADRRVLYVTSEESAYQLRMRASRLSHGQPEPASLLVLADTNVARILEQARKVKPEVMIIDSIQMIFKGDLPSAPGSVAQLRACCLELVYQAKLTGCATLLVGHVTKQGNLAGPRLLEHMVDAVVYFEGDRYHAHRVVRGIKNRFGNTLEVGLFEMTDRGLMEVDANRGLLADAYQARPGSVVCPVIQGSRCLLVEIQALTATGFLGSAKRKVSGLDASRLAMLIAVLEKHSGQKLADQDVFASAVGGMKVIEPAADLAIALAIAGAHQNKPMPVAAVAVGEIGLGGELRPVSQLQRRISELARLGFKHLVIPPVLKDIQPTLKAFDGTISTCKTIDQAMEVLQ